jgi:hypothetical protein
MDTEAIAMIAAGLAVLTTVGFAVLGVTGIKTIRGIRKQLGERSQRGNG